MTDTLEYKGIKILYLGHSGFIITKGEHRIVLDPFLTGAPMAVKKPADIKASDILLTHGHQDHLGDAVEIAKNNQAKISAVMELAEYCAEQGAETIRLPIGGTWQYSWGSAQFRYAMHSGFLPNGKPFGQAASILLNFGNVKIYDLGDTALQQDFKLVGEIYKPDIAFVPIGGRANMNINEALIAARWLGAGVVVPIHYDLYTEGSVDPYEFKSKLESTTNIQCMVMRP